MCYKNVVSIIVEEDSEKYSALHFFTEAGIIVSATVNSSYTQFKASLGEGASVLCTTPDSILDLSLKLSTVISGQGPSPGDAILALKSMFNHKANEGYNCLLVKMNESSSVNDYKAYQYKNNALHYLGQFRTAPTGNIFKPA